MPMKNEKQSEQLTAQLEEARTRHETLTTDVSAVGERLAKLKAEYQRAVESGEHENKLDSRDEIIIRGERELTRARIKLAQCKSELDRLEGEKTSAIAVEREERFRQIFDDICEDFLAFEMSLTVFQSHKDKIESSIRAFMKEASQSGRDTHRLRLTDNIRRQLIERLFPGYNSKHTEAYRVPLADVLEHHCRVVLNIPSVNGKVSPEVVTEQQPSNQEGVQV